MTVVQYSTLLDPHQLVEVVTRSSRDRSMRRTTLAMDRNTDAAMRPLPITDGCTGGIERHGSNCRNQTIRQDDLVVLHERLGRHSFRSHPLCCASRVIVLDFHSLLPKGSEYNEQTCCADCDRIPTSQDRHQIRGDDKHLVSDLTRPSRTRLRQVRLGHAMPILALPPTNRQQVRVP